MGDYSALFGRITDRSLTYPRVMSAGGFAIATDGFQAALAKGAGEVDAPEKVYEMLLATRARPLLWCRLDALRDWCGPAPVPMVLPCPEQEDHDAFVNGDNLDGGECYYGCQYVAGLGYAYEGQDRSFASSPDGGGWGVVCGLIVDRVRLAELLEPWPDCEVKLWTHKGALYVGATADSWRVVLMRGDEERIDAGSLPVFAP